MNYKRVAGVIFLIVILLSFRPISLRAVNAAGPEAGINNEIIRETAGQALTSPDQTGRPHPQASLVEAFSETAKLGASDSQAYDYFGISVALSGDTLVVGAYSEDGGPGDPLPDSGAVYVFERDLGGPANWGQAARLTASDTQSGDGFGASVAIDGDTLLVAAPGEDGGPGDPLPGAGAIYIFERNLGGPGNWSETKKLMAADPQEGAVFGTSVAISGDTLVVGAYGEESTPMNYTGAAYIFERDQGGPENWGEVKKLLASDGQDNDWFGVSVDISGDTVVVGAWLSHYPLGNGAAYIFERNMGGLGNWGEVVKLGASDAQASDLFGVSVNIDGDTVVVGAEEEDGGPGNPLPETGAAYIFERSLGWTETAKLTASDAQAADHFGWSVTISGDYLAVGAIGEDGGPGDPLPLAGTVYVFESGFSGSSNWDEVARLSASDVQALDLFGYSVAISGYTLAIGAMTEDGGPGDPLPNAGAAYVFQNIQRLYIPFISRK